MASKDPTVVLPNESGVGISGVSRVTVTKPGTKNSRVFAGTCVVSDSTSNMNGSLTVAVLSVGGAFVTAKKNNV